MAKLILTHEVTGLGAAGDIVEVKTGYARNYLLPRAFAITWSKGGEKQGESIKAARAARAVASLEEAQALAASLAAKPVAAAGLGSIDKRNIEINDHIKSTGNYSATVRLHTDVSATVALQVVAA